MTDDNQITFLIHSLRGGGAERVCVTLANGLAQTGWQVSLLALTAEEAVLQDQLADAIDVRTLGVDHARHAWGPLKRHIIENAPHRFLVFNPELAVLLVIQRALLRMPFAIIARNVNTLSRQYRMQASWWYKHAVATVVKLLYRRVDRVIAQSSGMEQDLVEWFRFAPAKVQTIHNPVSPELVEFAESSLAQSPPAERQSGPVLLFVGRLEPQKGVDYLLDAFARVRAQQPRAILHILGRGSLQQQLQQQAEQLGVRDHVHFNGFVRDVPGYYLHADATVLTSHYEGFPNVLVESITCGTPVVSFDCPCGPNEIIQHGVNGFLVRPLDVGDLAEKLLQVLEHPFHRRHVAQTARAFSPTHIIASYSAALSQVTPPSKNRRHTP